MIHFALSIASSPWKAGASKARFSCVRVALECTEVTSDSGATVSRGVFVYQRTPIGDLFDHIASAVELVELPLGEPWPGAEPQWFRKSTADLLFSCFEVANEAVEKIEDDLRFLAREVDSYRTLVGQRTEVVSDGIN